MKKNYLLLIIGIALMVITSCKKKDPVVPPVPTSGDVMSMPYTVSFENNFGTYTTKNVIGDQVWTIDYSSAVMTGHVNEGGNHTYYENEDWLISSPVKIKDVSHAKVVFNYAAMYQGASDTDITVQVSSNYTFGNDPSTATWTQLSDVFTNTENWAFTDKEMSLDAFIGQTVSVAVKFTSTTTKSRTIEIKSITIQEGQASGGGGGGGTPGEVQNLPYIQAFATSFGTYTTKDLLGDESWVIDYSSAKMTGYDHGANNANEDWLISSPVEITDVEHAKITMVYICRYFNNLNSDITLWASEDYQFDTNPSTATWTQIPATLSESSNWTSWKTAEMSLDEFIGKTVTIAVKYLSDTTKAGTIEIQSISVEEGEAGGVTPPPTPGPGAGSGTADDPYNVASGISLQGQDVVAWVQGYIVGAVRNGTSSVSSNDDIIWSGSFDSATNVVIADDATCTEISQCIIVNLPSGKPLRAQVNLLDNPDNLGKLLAVNGKLRTYFGQAGLRDSGGTENDFVLEGGVTPPPAGEEIYSESFANGQGDFEIIDVLMPAELEYVWAYASQYSCMKASAYVGQAYQSESWLVSPAIDLSGVDSAKLSFSQAVNYASPQGVLFVMISTNYNGDVYAADWTELSLDQWPAGSNWSFMTSNANLDSYVGQTVTIAFKYTSSANAAATWEVKNFKVEE